MRGTCRCLPAVSHLDARLRVAGNTSFPVGSDMIVRSTPNEALLSARRPQLLTSTARHIRKPGA